MAASYILPQVLVQQVLNEISAEIINPLRTWLVGPNANLRRYSNSDEKSLCLIGTYNPAIDNIAAWPHKTTGSVIDHPYSKLYMDEVRLQYYSDPVGSGYTVAAVHGYTNRIRSSGAAFVTNDAVSRSAAFLDRDVQLHDIVHVRGSYNGVTEDLWTYVRGFIAENVAASIGSATAMSSNASTQSQVVTVTQTAGTVNELRLAASLSTYNALIDGDLDDTYKIVVTEGSSDGDLTTASLRITSSDGYEYQASVTPDDIDTYFTVGFRKLQIKFTSTGVSSGISSGIALNDLIAGQTWTVRVQPAFTAPTITSGGTYTGKVDNTYIVSVTRGGLFNDYNPTLQYRPHVSIVTTNGTDGVTDLVITDQDVAYPVGHSGVTITFSGVHGLRKGDKFYIEASAAHDGRVSTLVLGHALSDTLVNATDLSLELYIQKDGVEISQYTTSPTAQFNWETTDSEITVHPDIYLYDSSWTSDGVQEALPVMSGKMYMEYREWLPTVTGQLVAMTDITEIDRIPGPLNPDNPLKWAASKALANCNGTSVRATAVADPDVLTSWTSALSVGTDRTDLYSLVPLTTDKAVLDLFVAHVNSMSTASRARWRGVFVPLTVEANAAIVTATTSTDEDIVLATISDDPDTTGTQYTQVTITSGNAGFVNLGVQGGDLLRVNFNTDPVGVVTYDEYVVDHVVNETTLILATGPDAALSVAQKIEVYHPRSTDELVADIGVQAGTYGNRRVCAVWPDVAGSGGTTFAGYHVCAALAGLSSGVVPQQNLTNVQVTGFDDVTRTTKLFTADQLDTLASYGVWIVTQDIDGTVYSRDALTTDMSSLETRTEMYRRNLDSISYVLRKYLVPYIGRANVVKGTLDQIAIDLTSGIEFLKTNGFTSRLGGQLIDATIVELRPNILQPSQIVITISLDLPFPVNTILLTLSA